MNGALEPSANRPVLRTIGRDTGRSPKRTDRLHARGQQNKRNTLRDCWHSRTRPVTGRLGSATPAAESVPGLGGGLPGRGAERFGMGWARAVVLRQDLGEAAGPVRDGAAADLAARDRQLGDGHREAAQTWLAHCFYDPSPVRVRCMRRAQAARRMAALSSGG